jgi:hypothetical protein
MLAPEQRFVNWDAVVRDLVSAEHFARAEIIS